MPNTLAHLGVQTLLGRAIQPKADIKWILVGCVIPDLSWIIQTIGRSDLVSVNLIDLRLYALVQSSLLFCLLVAAGLALLSRKPLRTFSTLAFAVIFHMLLDATQTKWGNGVLLGVPFNWTLLNIAWFWPEDWPSYALTALGLTTMIALWWRIGPAPLVLGQPPLWRLCAAAALFAVWVGSPMAFMAEAEARNLHNTHVLRDPGSRTGATFTADRNVAIHEAGADPVLRSWTGEELLLAGDIPTGRNVISLKGHFVDQSTVRVTAVRVHQNGPREWFSYAGLLLIAIWWGHALWKGKRLSAAL
ncbi:MAG: hypothetical protein AAFP98_10445 [Pseudomonadota bacterium]